MLEKRESDDAKKKSESESDAAASKAKVDADADAEASWQQYLQRVIPTWKGSPV